MRVDPGGRRIAKKTAQAGTDDHRVEPIRLGVSRLGARQASSNRERRRVAGRARSESSRGGWGWSGAWGGHGVSALYYGWTSFGGQRVNMRADDPVPGCGRPDPKKRQKWLA